MGSSYSEEARPLRKFVSRSTIKSFDKKSCVKPDVDQENNSFRLMKWKEVFISFVSQEQLPESHLWNKIQNALLSYVEKASHIPDTQWIANIQRISLVSPTICSQSLAQKEFNATQLTTIEKPPERQNVPIKASMGNISDFDMSPRRRKISCSSAASSRMFQISQVFSTVEKPSLGDELKKSLLSQFKSSNHIVFEIIKHFHSIYNHLFENCLEKLPTEKYTKEHEETYLNLTGIIKRFLRILSAFTNWIYQDNLNQLEKMFEDEEFGISFVIEDLLFELLFCESGLLIYDTIIKMLSLKHQDEIKKFREALIRKKSDSLVTYSELLKSTKEFLLEPTSSPYNEMTKKLKEVSSETNSYAKFEIAMFCQKDIWNCINYRYNDEMQVLTKLREAYCTEYILPILCYCVIQTQDENLVVERRFIEEFISPQILDFSYGFTVFTVAIDSFLNGVGSSRLSDDIRIRGFSMGSKSSILL